jgi:hypothetical protein
MGLETSANLPLNHQMRLLACEYLLNSVAVKAVRGYWHICTLWQISVRLYSLSVVQNAIYMTLATQAVWSQYFPLTVFHSTCVSAWVHGYVLVHMQPYLFSTQRTCAILSMASLPPPYVSTLSCKWHNFWEKSY